MDGPAGHRPIVPDVREVHWFTVRDGRVVDWWGLEDDDDRRCQHRGSSG